LEQRKREFLFVLKPYAEQLIEEDDSLDPLEMARVMRGAFPTQITPKILSQVWSLVDVTDPDRAINWTQIYEDAGNRRPISYYDGEAYCQAATFILEQYAGGRTLPQVLPLLELALCGVPKGFEHGEAGSSVRFHMGWDPEYAIGLCEMFFTLDELLDERDPVEAARWVIFALSETRKPSGIFFREHADSALRGPYPYPPGWPFRATDFPDDAEFYRGSGALFLRTRQPDGKEKLINYLGGKTTEVNMKMFGIEECRRIDFREFWETAALSSGGNWWGMSQKS
jgi:hypothetical protein